MPENVEAPTQDRKSLLGWKQALALITGLFLAGVVAVVVTTSYLDERAAEKFYDRTSGVVLEQKVKVIEERAVRQESKLDSIEAQQTQILLKLGEVNGKLDKMEN